MNPSHAAPDLFAGLLQNYGQQLFDHLTNTCVGFSPRPVLSQVAPGAIRERLPATAPQEPEALDALLADIEPFILPGITHMNAPGNLGYIPLSIAFPAWVGGCLALALNQTRALWRVSPAATEVEQVVLDWLRQMMGLPKPLFGMIHPNSAVLEALVAARESATDLSVRRKGMGGGNRGSRLRLYASEQAHPSVKKAAIVSGIGEEGVRTIETDEAYRLDPVKLEQAIVEDLQAGWHPFATVATVGTTRTGSIDPVPQIADLCERYGLWLHVDAAFGGLVALLAERREVLAGCERADSLTVNPHKWLGVPLGCSVLYTRKPEAFKAAFALPTDDLHGEDEIINLGDYTSVTPHGFPALCLWVQMRAMGQRGLSERIRTHLDLAHRFALWLDSQPEVERLAPVSLQIVCFRLHPVGMDEEERVEAYNKQALVAINARGHVLLSSTRLAGRLVLRAAFGAMQTEERLLPILQQEVLRCLMQWHPLADPQGHRSAGIREKDGNP